MAVAPVFYSVSPYGAGASYDLQNNGGGTLTISITSGVATLSVAQDGNIGVGCDIDYGAGNTHVYIAPNRLGFDSGGTTELKTGDKIEGNSSGATGIVRAIEITSGSWAGGDAAGYIYFSTTTGTWQDNEQINRTKPSSSSNICTADGTLQGNMGNGDTQFVVKAADGSDAGNDSDDVNDIYHEYSSLSGLEAGFTDSYHIQNADLTAVAVQVFACCYYDHDNSTDDTTAVSLDWSGTTDADNYFQCYTPVGDSESINDQRHAGKWDGDKYVLIVATGAALTVNEDFIRIEGLQIEATRTTTAGDNCIYLNAAISTDFRAYSCLLSKGRYTVKVNQSSDAYFINNIFYDSGTGGIVTVSDSHENLILYNNTFIDNGTYGVYQTIGTILAKNNIIQNSTNSFQGTISSSSSHNVIDESAANGAFGATHSTGTADSNTENHLVDSGATFQTDGVQVGSIVKNTTDTTYGYVTVVNSETDLTLDSDVFPDGNENYSVYTNMYGSPTFLAEGSNDFHLDSSDTVAQNKGADLTSDATFAFWEDIEREVRSDWDVGADEYVAPAGGVSPTGVLYGPLVGCLGGPI